MWSLRGKMPDASGDDGCHELLFPLDRLKYLYDLFSDGNPSSRNRGVGIYIYYLKKGQFEDPEDVKYQLFRENDSKTAHRKNAKISQFVKCGSRRYRSVNVQTFFFSVDWCWSLFGWAWELTGASIFRIHVSQCHEDSSQYLRFRYVPKRSYPRMEKSLIPSKKYLLKRLSGKVRVQTGVCTHLGCT